MQRRNPLGDSMRKDEEIRIRTRHQAREYHRETQEERLRDPEREGMKRRGRHCHFSHYSHIIGRWLKYQDRRQIRREGRMGFMNR